MTQKGLKVYKFDEFSHLTRRFYTPMRESSHPASRLFRIFASEHEQPAYDIFALLLRVAPVGHRSHRPRLSRRRRHLCRAAGTVVPQLLIICIDSAETSIQHHPPHGTEPGEG